MGWNLLMLFIETSEGRFSPSRAVNPYFHARVGKFRASIFRRSNLHKGRRDGSIGKGVAGVVARDRRAAWRNIAGSSEAIKTCG